MGTFALRLAALLLLGAWSAAQAQTPATVFLEELTSPELAAQIRAGKSTLIVPIGGTEQNGPHMALGKHNFRAKALAEKIAIALANAIVAPVIAYVPEGAVNPPTGHMRYPGTITVPGDTYRKVLESAARSFRLAGFRDIVLLGDSGEYQKDDLAVAQQLNREWAASNVRVHAVRDYYRVSTVWFTEALKGRGYSEAEIGIHAGLADTSLMLAIDPRMVRSDLMQPASGQKGLPGVTGDPRRASAELGKLAVDAIVAQTVAAIRAAVASH
jgi:creatinine amidohydrolase/Fe(II)-dependent formamide hydrolase-like protein